MAEIENSDKITIGKIIRVSFPQPVNGKVDWFFGCLAAIYDLFTEEQIGCKLTSLQASKFEYKATRRCTITKLPIYRKKQKYGRKKE